MPVGNPATSRWLVLLLVTTITAAAPTAPGEVASRANRPSPPAETLLTTDHDEPVHDHPYGRSQARPTLPQENTDPDPIAATAGRLAAALLRALAEPPLTATPNARRSGAAAEDPWRRTARELAGNLLEGGRLSALLREPAVAAAMVQELRGLRCEVAAVDEQQPQPPQRPDSGAAGGAPLPGLPPLSGKTIDSLRTHAGTHVVEGGATASSLVQPTALPHQKQQDESGGGLLLRAPRSAGANCAADGDCPPGQYCRSTGVCVRCSYISPTNCDDASGDCCSATFRTQCPANPADCCERDGDCSGDEVCSASVCTCSTACQKAQSVALLAAFVRASRAGAAWGALGGWSNASEPCAGSGWEGVRCDDHGRVTGVILPNRPELRFELGPAVGNVRYLSDLRLYGTGMFGTIPRELGSLTDLYNLDLHSNLGLSGTLPALTNATGLFSLNVDNCSLTGPLPTSLPSAISHVYLNHNPIRATASDLSTLLGSLPGPYLHVLDVGFSLGLQLDLNRYGVGWGTRVGNPSPCHIGAKCEFTLHMYDRDDQPARVGGLVSGLRLRLNSGTDAAMVDNRDGTFTASIPAGWIHSKGPQLFHFLDWDGVEFKPSRTAEDTIVADSSGDSLRTVEFLPRECLAGTHTVADATGATCVCENPEKFEPDTATNSSNTLSCHRRCRPDESVSSDGGSCVCSGDNYDTNLHGTLLCSTNGWEDVHAKSISAFSQAQETRRGGGKCVSCPSECTRCEDGSVTVLEGWRFNSTSARELRSQLAAGKDGRPQWLYSCPYEKEDCPEIKLSAGTEEEDEEDETLLCPSHHDGPLCATCEQGFSRRGSSDNRCEECSDMSGYIEAQFGLSAGWFSLLVAAIVAAVGGAAYMLQAQLSMLNAEIKTNLRILLGSAQVLSLLPSVLELVFPTKPKEALSFVAIFAADLRSILRTECWGWSWYDRWAVSVFGLPAVAVVPVVVYWLWCRVSAQRVDSDSREVLHVEAKVTSLKALAFLAMLLYPQFSSSIFSALRCEQLGEASSFLEADYSVSCVDKRYRHYRTAAVVMVFVVPLGFPLALLVVLLRSWRQSRERWEQAQAGAGDSSSAVGDNEEDQEVALTAASLADYHYGRVQQLFGFAMEDYRPSCFWFEPVDLLRKLALSGLLQFMHRGTAAQCCFGCGIAFASFGLQQWLRPYRELTSNVLKALVDTQLFLTFLISFILRVLPDIESSEPFGKEVYGWVLLCSMVALLCCAVGLTAVQIRRHHRFKARLLENEDGLGVLLTRGSSGQGAQRQPDLEQEDPTAGDDATVVAVVGLSRPVSPGSTTENAPDPELELEPELG